MPIMQTSTIEEAVARMGPLLHSVFSACGAFAPAPADFDRAAAFAVCNAGPRTEEVLRRLIRLGLLQDVAPGRLKLPPEASAVAQDRLGGETEPRARHAAFYRTLVSKKPTDWQTIEREWPQVERAWLWASGPTGSAKEVLRLLSATSPFLTSRGRLAERTTWTERALTAARSLAIPKEEATQLNNLATCFADSREHAQAIEHYQAALRISEEVGDRAGTAATLVNLATTYLEIGDIAHASECCVRALPIQRELRNRNEAVTLFRLGDIYQRRGEGSRAIQAYEEALIADRETGDGTRQASIQNHIGMLLLQRGDTQKAFEFFGRAQNGAEAMGDLVEEAHALDNLSRVRAAQHDMAEAMRLMHRAAALFERANHPDAASYRARLVRVRSNVKGLLLGCATAALVAVAAIVGLVWYLIHRLRS